MLKVGTDEEVLPAEEIGALFPQLFQQVIGTLNSYFLHEFRECIEGWKPYSSVGKVLLKHVCVFLLC